MDWRSNSTPGRRIRSVAEGGGEGHNRWAVESSKEGGRGCSHCALACACCSLCTTQTCVWITKTDPIPMVSIHELLCLGHRFNVIGLSKIMAGSNGVQYKLAEFTTTFHGNMARYSICRKDILRSKDPVLESMHMSSTMCAICMYVCMCTSACNVCACRVGQSSWPVRGRLAPDWTRGQPLAQLCLSGKRAGRDRFRAVVIKGF